MHLGAEGLGVHFADFISKIAAEAGQTAFWTPSEYNLAYVGVI